MKVYRVTVTSIYTEDVFVVADNLDGARKAVKIGKIMNDDPSSRRFVRLHGKPSTWKVSDDYPEAAPDEPIIQDIYALAKHLGIDDEEDEYYRMRKSFERLVYKGTNSGCSFWCDPNDPCPPCVIISGYCEGTDAECPNRQLWFPFPAGEWDRTLAKADQDGIDLWNETHGCEHCWGGHNYYPGATEVDPDCEHCGGNGIIY